MLVNNAGITRDGLAMRMKPADWDLVLKINLDGAFLCCQQALPGMMKNRWGRIVNMASVVGQAGSAGQANYAASKAGLIGLTKALAQEMASRGITVNAVAPGYIDTDMTKVLPEEVQAEDSGGRAAGTDGQTRRHRRRGEVSGQRGRRLHHRPRAGRQRRHVHVGGDSPLMLREFARGRRAALQRGRGGLPPAACRAEARHDSPKGCPTRPLSDSTSP